MPAPSEKTIKNLIVQTVALEEQTGQLLLKIDENKKKIQKYFDSTHQSKIIVEPDDKSSGNLICKKCERCTIKYDVEKLKSKLDDEIFTEVTQRTYEITDINAMIGLIKHTGIKAKDFKNLLNVKVTADNAAIKRLYEAGEITMNQLKGTYKATISKTIKISGEDSEKK